MRETQPLPVKPESSSPANLVTGDQSVPGWGGSHPGLQGCPRCPFVPFGFEAAGQASCSRPAVCTATLSADCNPPPSPGASCT